MNELKTGSVVIGAKPSTNGRKRTPIVINKSTKELNELWDNYGRLAYFYANMRAGRVGQYDNGNSVEELAHDIFLKSVAWYRKGNSSFNTTMWHVARRIVNHAITNSQRQRRSGIDVELTKTMPDGTKREFLSGDNCEFENAVFLDSLNELPEFEAGLARHCIDNAHKYYNKTSNGKSKIGLKTGESSGLVLDYCNGSLWRARRATRMIRAWLRGEDVGDILRADVAYRNKCSGANKKSYNKRKSNAKQTG